MAQMKKYKVTQWNGIDNYTCLLCPFEILNESKMIEHVNRFHALDIVEKKGEINGKNRIDKDNSGGE